MHSTCICPDCPSAHRHHVCSCCSAACWHPVISCCSIRTHCTIFHCSVRAHCTIFYCSVHAHRAIPHCTAACWHWHLLISGTATIHHIPVFYTILISWHRRRLFSSWHSWHCRWRRSLPVFCCRHWRRSLPVSARRPRHPISRVIFLHRQRHGLLPVLSVSFTDWRWWRRLPASGGRFDSRHRDCRSCLLCARRHHRHTDLVSDLQVVDIHIRICVHNP